MELRVNHNELNSVAKESSYNAELLDTEIDKLTDSINALKDIWQGKDSDEFCDKAYHFLKNLRIVPGIYRTFDSFIERVDENYKDINEEYSKELDKVGEYHEK